MKRIGTFLVAICILAASVMVTRSVCAQASCMEGDTNHDGTISLVDYQVWRNIFKNGAPSSPTPGPSVNPSNAPTGMLWGFAAGCCTPQGITMTSQLDGYKALGAQIIRVDFSWPVIEPNAPSGSNHAYDFSKYDGPIKIANDKGIKVIAIPQETAPWSAGGCYAQGGFHCPPKDFGEYATFVANLVERYDADGVSDAPGMPKVYAWEIWNEPNISVFWAPNPDAATYAQMLALTYAAAKQADSDSIILSAGLAPEGGTNAPIEFLKRMYANGAKGKFDALAFHPYSFPAMPSTDENWNAWQQMSKAYPLAGQPDSIRSVMEKNGDSAKKIWNTEFGAPTTGQNSVTETQQSQMLKEALDLWKTYPWAGPFLIYSYQDIKTGDSDIQNNFGVIHSDGTLKPAATMLKNL